MTERLADVSARIEGIRQLDAVVNAMTGIAAARARQAREQLAAVDGYAATIAAAMSRVADPAGTEVPSGGSATPRRALVVFCAEQGFAGAFSERVLDAVGGEIDGSLLFLVGTRGEAIAAARGVTPAWGAPMPSHSPGVPKLADRIVEAVYERIGASEIDRLEAAFSVWRHGRVRIERRRLLPIDPAILPPVGGDAPLMNLAPAALLVSLTGDYLHALICDAALHSFAAENEARMAAMAAARRQIEHELAALRATERRVRQDAITAEIIELATGERASRAARRPDRKRCALSCGQPGIATASPSSSRPLPA